MEAINHAGLVEHSYPVQDTLFFKIQGDPDAIIATSEVVQSIVKKHGSSKFKFAATDQEAEDLWQNRKYALMSTLSSAPGSKCWTTDVWLVFGVAFLLIGVNQLSHDFFSVPVSRLPELVYETKKDLADHNIRSTIVGHVGDGNFHALLLFKNDEEFERVSQAVHRMVYRAIALEGTCACKRV